MVVFTVVLAFLLALILWIIFIPVYLRINTRLGQYELKQAGIITIAFHPYQKPALTMRVIGIRVNVENKGDGAEKVKSEGHVTPRRKKSKRRIHRSPGAWLYLIRGMLNSIRLKKLTGTMDLDDVVLNAQLVPVMLLVSRGPVMMSVNFTKQYFLAMEMEARISKMIWVFIRFLIKR
jgi:hypothetical protein